ncbi:MAG: TetR/AcrR family transcriptional regulator [Stackebrandtia sp.]
MPKLWNATIEAHRHSVREAILHTTWALATKHGLTSVTMSQIAERTGIGRATLYKYFPDVEAILTAWHQQHVAGHLEHLTGLAGADKAPGRRLESVLGAYAEICRHREFHGVEMGALLHRGEHVVHTQQQLVDLFRDLLADAAAAGDVRDDVAPAELAGYCVHALAAAGSLPSQAAARRLVDVVLSGLLPEPS